MQIKRAGELWREKGRFGDGEITITKTTNAEETRETKNRTLLDAVESDTTTVPRTRVRRRRSCGTEVFWTTDET